MHELSITLNVLDVAAAEADRRGLRHVTAIHLRLGPLAGVVREALLSAFALARAEYAWDDCALIIEDMPAAGWCAACAAERGVESLQRLGCGACGQPLQRIVRGRELEVIALEVENDEQPDAPGAGPPERAEAQ